MASRCNGTLYVGVTRDLNKRVWQHKEGSVPGFTRDHQVKDLVYYEVFGEALLAIAREKQLKAGSRQKKILLIEKENPGWDDLYPTLG